VADPGFAREWGESIFSLWVYSRRAGDILRVIPISAHLNIGGKAVACFNGYGLSRLRFTMGSDIFLGGNGHH